MEALRQEQTGKTNILAYVNKSQPINPVNLLKTIANPSINVDIIETKTDLFQNIIISSADTDVKGTSQMNDQEIIIKYIDILDKDRRDMEARIATDKEASEERLQLAIEKIEKGQESVKKEVRGLTITVIIGIAAMIAASVLAIAQIFAQFASLIK